MANGPIGLREYARTIEALLDASAWSAARWLILEHLARVPEDHWLMAQLALTYLGEERVDEALADIDRAGMLAPSCPMVLWYRTAILSAQADRPRAASACRTLLELGSGIAGGDCGLGQRRATRLLAEATLRLARMEVEKEGAALTVDSPRALRRWTRAVPPVDADSDVPSH